MSADLTGNTIAPELGRQVLAELGELNAGFLDLLVRAHSHAGTAEAATLAMPPAAIEAVARLRAPALKRLTHCGFALFDLRLDDYGFWEALAPESSGKRYAIHSTAEPALRFEIGLFTLCALMYLRHLASVNRFLAGLSFGATDRALDAVCRLSLRQLQGRAARYPGLLCCRLGSNADAWSDLVRLARRTDGQPLLPARLLGLHHAPSG